MGQVFVFKVWGSTWHAVKIQRTRAPDKCSSRTLSSETELAHLKAYSLPELAISVGATPGTHNFGAS